MAEKKKRKKSSIQSRMPSASNKGQAGKKSRFPRLAGAKAKVKRGVKKTVTSLKERRAKRISENKFVIGERLTEAGRKRRMTRKSKRKSALGKKIAKGEKIVTKMAPKMKAAQGKVVRTVKTKGGDYKVYAKDSKQAQSFRSTFKSKCTGGTKSFTWQGRKYSCAKK
jgi:hypothetical protein